MRDIEHVLTAFQFPMDATTYLFAISNWFRQSLGDQTPTIDLSESVHLLYECASPSGGIGLFKIWEGLFVPEVSPDFSEFSTRTDQAAAGCPDGEFWLFSPDRSIHAPPKVSGVKPSMF